MTVVLTVVVAAVLIVAGAGLAYLLIRPGRLGDGGADAAEKADRQTRTPHTGRHRRTIDS